MAVSAGENEKSACEIKQHQTRESVWRRAARGKHQHQYGIAWRVNAAAAMWRKNQSR